VLLFERVARRLNGRSTTQWRSPVARWPCYCSSMIKTSRAKRKVQTHFEQVPLEVVKKVLGVEAVKTPARSIAKADIKPKAAGRLR
jgi:hypothetical protein